MGFKKKNLCPLSVAIQTPHINYLLFVCTNNNGEIFNNIILQWCVLVGDRKQKRKTPIIFKICNTQYNKYSFLNVSRLHLYLYKYFNSSLIITNICVVLFFLLNESLLNFKFIKKDVQFFLFVSIFQSWR